MKKTLCLIVLLCSATFSFGELKIAGPTTLPQNKIVRLTAEGAPAGSAYIWDVDQEDRVDIEEQGNRLLFTGAPGIFKVKVRSILFKDGKTLIETARATITIGEPTPVPPGPVPPGPTPVPPGPTPGPLAGMRVLMLYESGDTLPAAQHTALTAKSIRDYLNSKCSKGPDGKTAEWRQWDFDSDASATPKAWQDLKAKGKKGPPWVIIADAATNAVAFEGPLPESAEALLNLLKKYGG